MTSNDPLVMAFRALCDGLQDGFRTVAAETGLSEANLRQIYNGTALPSGNARGVGPQIRKRLTEVYPKWLNPNIAAKMPTIPVDTLVAAGHHGASFAGKPESNVAPAPSLSPSNWLPVVGHVRAGPDGYLEEMQYPVGHGEGYVEYWTKDATAYALRIKGDSMHPRYRAGEYIVVTPAIEPQPGRDVVVKLRNGQSLLKQLNWVRGGELQLLSINNGYAPHTIALEEIESIQRVAGSVPPDAFSNERPL